MLKITLIGYGNVGFHLANALLKAEKTSLYQIYNRDITKLKELNKKVKITNNLEQLQETDVYIISVSDDAIKNISKQLSVGHKLVIHTSGSSPLKSLDHLNTGVLYPLQTFSKSKPICFSNIPICIEGNSKENEETLAYIAEQLSDYVYCINSEQRKSLHVSAVFVCNFVNHLYYLGQQLCTQYKVPFEVLTPLIKETAEKIENLTPFEAQTGPARRNDTTTIEKHITLLNENQKEIYTLLTQSIYKTYNTNGEKL